MSRTDLHEARTEIGIDIKVAENGDLAVDDGQLDLRTHELVFVMIFRRHRNARIAEHGLGARGSDHNIFHAVNGLDERVAKMPQVAIFFLIFRFVIGNGGTAGGTPVHDALAAVDKAVMVPIAEHLAHGGGIFGTMVKCGFV